MFRYENRKRNYDEGVVTEVIKPSVDRVEPKCVHFGVCGGCSLQHLASSAQIEAKQQILVEQFRHLAGMEIEHLLPALVSEPWGYRHKARLGVRYVHKKERVLVGFRERNSSFLADLQRCEVLHPSVGEHLEDLAQLIAGLSIYQAIPQIEVAVADDATALVFRHLEPFTDEDIVKLGTFAEQHGFHIYLQPKGPDTIHLLWPEQSQLFYAIPGFNVRLQFRPSDFTQVNRDLNQQMVKRAIELLELQPKDRVLDLFCGLGNFTLPIATQVDSVIGVEGEANLVVRARDNASLNGLVNAEFHAADLNEDMLKAEWARQSFDKLLLDPPRSGAFEVLKLIPQLGAKRVVYVSCNPSTLARDAAELVNNYGYQLISAGVMDMFPHTSHVESIAVFEKS
jgi:23S rRNA (uracil1939-C5)-methyltransferase